MRRRARARSSTRSGAARAIWPGPRWSSTIFGGCSIEEAFAFGWPQGGVTPQSQRMFDLWIGSTIAALAVGVFVWGLIFWCIVRYRKRGDELPVQTRFNLPIELIYSVVPFLIVSVLFYYTAIVQTDVNRLTPNPDLTVSVGAAKWNWQFSYPGTQGPDGAVVTTIGTDSYVPVLVLPTNQRIRFEEQTPRGPGDKLSIAVLMGGVGFERDVSLVSGREVANALVGEGHTVRSIVLDGTGTGFLDELVGVDVVFLALHGEFGEDGTIQHLLGRRGLTYTGSGPEASADCRSITFASPSPANVRTSLAASSFVYAFR